MSRPMTQAPLERVHRVKRGGEVARGLLAGFAVLAALLAVPVLLLVAAGSPLPTSGGGLVGSPAAARTTVKIVACLGWLGWAQFVPCLLVEAAAGVRGTGLPRRVPFAFGAQQELARRLVTPVLLLTAGQGLRSAARPVPAHGGQAGHPGPGRYPPSWPGPTGAGAPAGWPPGTGPAGIAWDVAHAGLLATGLVGALHAARRRAAQTRRPGDPVSLPDAEAAGVETAAWLGADPDGAAFLDRALRVLAAGLAARERPVPEFYAARLSADRLDLLLATPDGAPPPPFVTEPPDMCWSVRRDAVPARPDGTPSPLPGLVSVGTTGPDGTGVRVLIDLESVGGTVCVDGTGERGLPGGLSDGPSGGLSGGSAGGLDAARSLVAAAALELATSPWSEGARVTMVGFGHAVQPIGPDRLRCVDTLGEISADLVARMTASRGALTASGIDSVLTGRVRGLAGGDCRPDLVLFATPPDLAVLAALEACARAPGRAPLGIMVAGPVPSARVRFTVDPRGAVRAGPLGDLAGQRLTARSFAALTRLFDSGTPVAAIPRLPGPVDPDAPAGVLLRILGEPAVDGPGLASPGTALAVEICAQVALRGQVRVDELAAAVWPYGVADADRDATLHRVRDWLGHDPGGRPRLRWDGGVLALSDDVRLDWHLFVALARRAGPDDLRRALELVRGPLAEPRPRHRYGWLAADPAAYHAGPHVVDTAHRYWQDRMAVGDPAGAAAAAEAGLRAEPVAGVLWDDLAGAVRARDGDAAAAELLRTRRPR